MILFQKIVIGLLLIFSHMHFLCAMDAVTIENIRPASEKTKLIIQKAAQEMQIPFSVSVQAATISNAGGFHKKYSKKILIDEEKLLQLGEDSLIYTSYHEVGHIKDELKPSTKIMDAIVPYSMYLCAPLLCTSIGIFKQLRTIKIFPIVFAAAIGTGYLASNVLEKMAYERKETAADFYACQVLLWQKNLGPIATKLAISKQHALLKKSIHFHNPRNECKNIETILTKSGYSVSYDTSNALSKNVRKSLSVTLKKDNESHYAKLSWE